MDEHANYHDIVATLVNLGQRGVLRIRPIADPQGHIRDYLIESTNHNSVVERRKTPRQPPLPTQEETTRHHPSQRLRAEFDREVPKFKLALYEEASNVERRATPDRHPLTTDD
ncbi:MAG: hypothetical protein U0232_14925 [Thermomicrobiales bacterium]